MMSCHGSSLIIALGVLGIMALSQAAPGRAQGANAADVSLLEVRAGTSTSGASDGPPPGAPGPTVSTATLQTPAPADIPDSEYRDCSMTCASIKSAVDRYNRWWRLGKITDITPASLQILVDKKFLPGLPDDPGQGPGTSSHFKRSAFGPWVTCTFHSTHRRRPRPSAAAAPMSAGDAVRTVSDVIRALRQQAQQDAARSGSARR